MNEPGSTCAPIGVILIQRSLAPQTPIQPAQIKGCQERTELFLEVAAATLQTSGSEPL
ncbi:MAG: hypothetical protein JZU50_12525 [Desulfobulbaceae bacterium]|nr:hypothetical protein [Desulfobulbaceae bacterium]